MRPDVLEGTVVQVLDPGVLEVEVVRLGSANRLRYSRRERVRVSTWRDGAADLPPERRSALLAGQRVKVLVHARDPENMVFGDVEVLQDGEAS